MNVNVHIEQITLDGLDVAKGHEELIRTAISSELHWQLQRTSPEALRGRTEYVNEASSPPVKASGDIHALGTRLGRTIHQQVAGGTPT